ncbi:MAG: alpha-amylase family glycosyl hydrolase, partial [Spirochaetales bacterium]|nr:alpha-amylase family glycosyl hydrolase [Spirochaetales bacterium]
YLSSLGITAVYLNPIFLSRSVHRYDTVDFSHVDDKLGGDEALTSMVNTLHSKGIKVILDISINHTGLDAVWLKKAKEDEKSDEHDFYYFQEDGSVACWQDVKTLPQLKYSSELLRNYMYRNQDSIMKKFLLPPFDIDAWRLDVAPEVGRRGNDQLCKEVWREVRSEVHKVKKDVYLVGEDWDDTAPYMDGDIWDGTMNYYGSGRPLRSWMGQRDRFLSEGTGHTAENEKPWSGEDEAGALNEAIASVSDQNVFFQMNLFDSHDTPRLHNDKRVFDRDIYKGVVMVLYMLPGMPNLYYGDEVGLGGKLGSNEGARYPMEWREEYWDKDMLSFHKAMGEVRKEDWLGFSSYSITPIDEKAFAIKRFIDGKALVAIINRGEKRECELPLFLLPSNNAEVVVGKGEVRVENNSLKVSLMDKESVLISLKN